MKSTTPHPAFGHLLPMGEGHVQGSPKPPKRKSLAKRECVATRYKHPKNCATSPRAIIFHYGSEESDEP